VIERRPRRRVAAQLDQQFPDLVLNGSWGLGGQGVWSVGLLV
jgi:hypothetical protein